MQFYQDYFRHIPKDDFGYSSEWNGEVNKWLEYLFSVDKKSYEINKKRVMIDKQRDEFLGEIKTLYFLGKLLGLSIIAIEPDGKGQTKLDLSIKDLNDDLWKVEVETPSWLGQLWKNPNVIQEYKKWRASQPKYINGEAGSFSSEEEILFAVEDSIKNALPKFKEGDNNLLVICPEMHHQIMTMLGISEMKGGSSAIQSELTFQDVHQLISSVLILEPFLPSDSGNVDYAHMFFPITKKPLLPSVASFYKELI
jgi:hypothetical protein